MKAMVFGGAGYIGSHMCRMLADSGHEVLVFDNLSTGHRAAVKWGHFIDGDLLDAEAVESAIRTWSPDVVFHFAALSIVRESVRDPVAYYQNNVVGTINLIASMQRHGVLKLVFSSTAAVYGIPDVEIIAETQPTSPINAYGASKLMVERMLADAATAYGLRSVSLRYFNAAGADQSSEIGESHYPETHLIPNVLRAAADQTVLEIFGTDYDTEDGTCIRDYVHVNDLADAHLLAAQFVSGNEGAHCFNLGAGKGFSVLQVIEAAERVVGRSIVRRSSPRRDGDPAKLISGSARARQLLGWNPQRSSLEEMLRSAWSWHRNRAY